MSRIPRSESIVDTLLRTLAFVMAIGAVALLAMKDISIENAIIMLGIAIVALVLERIREH